MSSIFNMMGTKLTTQPRPAEKAFITTEEIGRCWRLHTQSSFDDSVCDGQGAGQEGPVSMSGESPTCQERGVCGGVNADFPRQRTASARINSRTQNLKTEIKLGSLN